MTNKAVAALERVHDSTVKDLSKLYMAEQVHRAGMPAPRAIGIDEIAIHKGHDYRVVVSDLERGRPIWFGGSGRSEADIDQFFADLGPKKSARIERSEEHTSELKSLMRKSYAVFCLKKKNI